MFCHGGADPNLQENIMDKNRIKGTAKQAAGTVKEGLGKLTGNKSLEAEGVIEKAEGVIQTEFGKAKDALKKG